MKYFGNGLSELHKELNSMIRKPDKIQQAKDIFLKLHGKLHKSKVSDGTHNEVDELVRDLEDEEYSIMPTSRDETIAWVLWHIARIEDLTMNILIADGNQVFDDRWKTRLNTTVTDTGNALTDEEIICLSKSLNIPELLNYRNEVGRRTREIVQNLLAEDMKRNVSQQGLDRILSEGGITQQEDSIWLLDFWGKKDVAGLLLMPPTRHVIMHLNDCCKWKSVIRTKKKTRDVSEHLQ